MRGLVPLIRNMGASMLFALAAALPAAAQREEQLSAWCYTYGPARASDAQVIEVHCGRGSVRGETERGLQ